MGTHGALSSQELHVCQLKRGFGRSLGHRGQMWAHFSVVADEFYILAVRP